MTVYSVETAKSMDNFAMLHGTLLEDFKCSGDFCVNTLCVTRASGAVDEIPIAAPKPLADRIRQKEVTIFGEWRSRNRYDLGKTKTEHYLLVREVREESADDQNEITLTGYLCKKPNFRKTGLGKEICELLVAVHRQCGKSDYLHCIVWNQNARKVSNFNVGDKVSLVGRIQSRPYLKIIDGVEYIKTAYEVSARKVTKEE